MILVGYSLLVCQPSTLVSLLAAGFLYFDIYVFLLHFIIILILLLLFYGQSLSGISVLCALCDCGMRVV